MSGSRALKHRFAAVLNVAGEYHHGQRQLLVTILARRSAWAVQVLAWVHFGLNELSEIKANYNRVSDSQMSGSLRKQSKTLRRQYHCIVKLAFQIHRFRVYLQNNPKRSVDNIVVS